MDTDLLMIGVSMNPNPCYICGPLCVCCRSSISCAMGEGDRKKTEKAQKRARDEEPVVQAPPPVQEAPKPTTPKDAPKPPQTPEQKKHAELMRRIARCPVIDEEIEKPYTAGMTSLAFVRLFHDGRTHKRATAALADVLTEQNTTPESRQLMGAVFSA